MKKINKLMATLLIGVVGVMGIGTVYADEPNTSGNGSNASGSNSNQQTLAGGKVTVDCEKYDLAVGASTTCTVYITPTAGLAAITYAKDVFITMSQSKYITINELNANTTNGYSLTSDGNISDRTLASHKIQLKHTGTLTEGKKTEIMSFRLKLEEAAKGLTAGQCGQLCVDGAEFDTNTIKATLTVGDSGKACPNIIITEQKCEGKDCNPDTGAFMNYAIIAGVASVALITIVISTRKKKFYTV